MSAQGRTVRDITAVPQVSDDYARDVIPAFDERGFDDLRLVVERMQWSWGKSNPTHRGRRPSSHCPADRST